MNNNNVSIVIDYDLNSLHVVELTKAYKLVLKAILPPEAEEEVNVTLSVTEAFQTLHSTISAVGLKLDACSNNTKALRKILEDLPRFIRRNDIERVC